MIASEKNMKTKGKFFFTDSAHELFLPFWLMAGSVLFLFLFLLFSKVVLVFFMSSSYFQPLSCSEIFLSFACSFRYDAYVVAHFLLPLLLAMFFPVPSKWYLKILSVLIIIMLGSICLFTVADLIFFSMFSSHMTTEAITALAHIPFILSMALRTYWYITFPVLVGFLWVGYLLCKIIDQYYTPPSINKLSLCLRVSLILLLGAGIFFGIKGKLSFHGRSLSSMTAQKLPHVKMADIALNGVFASFESMRHYKKRDLFFPENKAKTILTDWFLLPQERILSPQYPLWRIRKDTSPNAKRNIVIILLESWDMKYIKAKPEVTPFFRKIMDNSIYYEHFYSAGKRSLLGVTASFFSIPYVWGLPYLNTGLEKYNFPRWASLLQQKGIKTIFVQSDYRLSEKAANWTAYLGFEEFYGKEDIPTTREYPTFNKGFDYEAGEFLFQRLQNTTEPFFAVFYTSSTHSPYSTVLSHEYMPFKNPQNQYEEYYNRLNYADAALENFFQLAESEEWFKNTIFFILPDHRAIFHGTLFEKETPYDSFLLVYAPYLLPAQHNTQVIAGQEDLLVSAFDIMGADIPYASAGSSIFDSNRRNEKFVYGEDGQIYFFNKDGFKLMRLNDLKGIPVSSWKQTAQEAILLNEGLYHTIRQNHILPKE